MNDIKQRITETLEKNYMPYAMSVIVSRAIPEIDGFKPSHRKLLYTIYKMKLLSGPKTKSANVVGQTMKLNPHGDQAIYATLVRLTRGYDALLHPYVDSKGNFGKVSSRDMRFAASRYTEVKLDGLCEEVFKDIEKNTVDYVDNYDGRMKEPVLLPTRFPNVLVSANRGIAVGMASNICSFNLQEICTAVGRYIDDPEVDLSEVLTGPDFPTGGYLIYDEAILKEIYASGTGVFKIRAKYRFDPKNNCLEIITPKANRGCQISIVAHGQGKALYNKLIENGVIPDWREPNVIRCAPVPMYNSFEDIYRFGEILNRLL